MLEAKLSELNRVLSESAGFAEQMLVKTFRALERKDTGPLRSVIEIDEPRSNDYETQLDEKCAVIIAQFQPKAMNLRNVLMVLKMNNDLERIADHIAHIADSCLYLLKKGMMAPCDKLPMMSGIVVQMLHDSHAAFADRDCLMAARVCVRDSRVNGLRDEMLLDLVGYMRENPGKIKNSLHVLRIASNLERIADLCKNICEDVIFLVEGRVTKHNHGEVPDGRDAPEAAAE